jgi:transposase
MEKDTTTYVGLDDSKRTLVVAILRPGSESRNSGRCQGAHLIQRLFRRLAREGAVAACYEAGVSGYDLSRQITACGVACQVIARR